MFLWKTCIFVSVYFDTYKQGFSNLSLEVHSAADLAPTLIKLWFSNDLEDSDQHAQMCLWLGLELNSAGVGQIWGSWYKV